jgi:thiamine phosphate synthase YjbQ (UPF0047 family)
VIELRVETERRTQLVEVTDSVRAAVAGAGATLATLFVPHTTAGIVVQASGHGTEHGATAVEAPFDRLIDQSGRWRHVEEGDRNP